MASGGHLAHLSATALRLVVDLGESEANEIARWLYDFGRLPRSPRIDNDFGSDDEAMAVLGLSPGSQVRRTLEQGHVASTDAGWYSFMLRPLQLNFQPAAKLYVSPMPEALADSFPIIVNTFIRADVRSFKVGRGSRGLLRPDKIVAYVPDRAQVEELACSLVDALAGCPVHGVPFTAELGGDGLVSWGIDPPAVPVAMSWRSRITRHLGASLAATALRTNDDPVAVALAGLRTVGVDPDTWAPIGDGCMESTPS